MIDFKPAATNVRLGQPVPAALDLVVPPPSPDVLYTGYTGVPGLFETLIVLAATSTGGVLGIATGLNKENTKNERILGWVAGIGATLAGLLYLGGKTGLNQAVGLPAVRVTPN